MMTEVQSLENQIADLKAKLKIAKKKEVEAKRAKIMKYLEEHGILDMDEKQLEEHFKAIKKPAKKPAEPDASPA